MEVDPWDFQSEISGIHHAEKKYGTKQRAELLLKRLALDATAAEDFSEPDDISTLEEEQKATLTASLY